jgi:hypothetical protein
MNRLQWFERSFSFGQPAEMLPLFLDRMEGTELRMAAKLRNVPEHVLANNLDGKWSIKVNLGHLADVEEISEIRIPEILNGISPMSPAVFEPPVDYNSVSLEELINKFADRRRKTLHQYRKLDVKDLSKTSLHPRLKVQMNAVDLALFHAEHDDHHLVRINEILIHFNQRLPYVNSKSAADH